MARSSTTWKKGECPNPGGRPKISREIRELAQSDAKGAYAKVKAISDRDGDRQQLAAALAILKAAGVSLSEERAPDTGNPAPPPNQKPVPTADLLAAATTEGEA